MSKKFSVALTAVLFASVGCGGSGSTADSHQAPSGVPAVTASAPPTPTAALPKPPEGYDPKRNAAADITAALTAAKADGRPVLLDFGANWCPDCVVLQRTFRSDKVRPILSGFHVVAVDVGRFDRNLGLARKYHLDLQKSGIPALVVLSDAGAVKTATNDGSFANARSMTADEVAAFLERWR